MENFLIEPCVMLSDKRSRTEIKFFFKGAKVRLESIPYRQHRSMSDESIITWMPKKKGTVRLVGAFWSFYDNRKKFKGLLYIFFYFLLFGYWNVIDLS